MAKWLVEVESDIPKQVANFRQIARTVETKQIEVEAESGYGARHGAMGAIQAMLRSKGIKRAKTKIVRIREVE